jgi:L-threonylcarbamoyladenylate synthase
VCDVAVVTRMAEQLAEAFWPGPLTLVLPKLPVVPGEVTAGLKTVAVRVPSHLIARAVLRAAGVPIAAPSANLFGRPSPTRAEHVLHDLDGRIDAVLDGGPTDVGLESTIVDVSGGTPRLLRPGGVAAEAIETVLGQPLEMAQRRHGAQLAPGMLESHYAPRTPLVLITGARDAARARLQAEVRQALNSDKRVGALVLDEDEHLLPPGVHAEVVGAYDEPAGSAARLFAALRTLDFEGLDVLYVRELAEPTEGLGRALADRLRRAARYIIATSQT